MTPRQADLGVNLVALAVVASVAVALAGLTWRLTGTDTRAAVAAVVPVPPAAPLDLSPVTRLAPFGTAVAVAGVAGDPTTLGLQLRGVMLARPRAASTALIAATGGVPKAFAVGEILPGGAQLESVEFDLVVLRVNGRLETLAFPVTGGMVPAGAPATAAGGFDEGPSQGRASGMGGAAPVEQYRARAADPTTLLDSLGASASPDGYRIGADMSDDMRRAGMQPGDIIEKVNGTAVGDPARDRALFDEAVVAGVIRVEVVRDGKRIAMSYPLR